MKVKHFSSKSNLTELDPSFMGSGVAGAQYKRGVPEHKSSFFYTHDSTPEDVVARQSPHEYEADLSNYKIYNLDDDKEGLVSEMKRRNQNAWNEDILHGIAKERGYHGILWSQSPETRVVQTYGKTPVTLKKGVARRLTGKLEPKNIPGKEETAEWQTSIGDLQVYDPDYDEETHQGVRSNIPRMEGGARFRAMNKLAGKTLSRRHPETGERQFLLFRGAGGDEISASKQKDRISHNQHSSWTPHKHIADGFSIEYDEQGHGAGTLASWINESNIHSIPMMHGKLNDPRDPDEPVDWTLAGNPAEKNHFSDEHEVVVSPHTSMRATKGDVAAHHARFGKISSVSPVKNINDRINLRAKKDIHDRQDKYPRAKYFPRPTPKKLAASELEKAPTIIDDADDGWTTSRLDNHTHTPSANKSISSNKMDDGLFHHHFTDGQLIYHTLSESPNHSDPAKAVLYGVPHKKKGGGLRVQISAVDPDHQGQGLGKKLYGLAAKTHGKIVSDSHLTQGSSGVYESYHYNNDPDFESNLGEGRKPHTLSFKGKLNKGQAGDWKKEGYTFDKSPNRANTDLIIHASHPQHGEAGRYVFQKMDGNLKVGEARTLRDHERKGLASQAYKMAEEHFGMKLVPTEGEQTERAKKLWAQPNRPFGKNEMKPKVVVDQSVFAQDLEKTEPKSPGETHTNGGRIAKYHPNGILMWHSSDEIAKNHDQAISNPELIRGFMEKVPESHRSLMSGIINSVAKDPNRHFIPTQENGKQKLRARHIKALILGNEDITMDTSKPGVVSITRKSHSGGKNAGSQISWNFRHGLGKSEENDGRGNPSFSGKIWNGVGLERGLHPRAGRLHFEQSDGPLRGSGRGNLNKSEISYEAETEKIKENKKSPEARKEHKFKAAKWTHKNGHLRCLICGDEERTGGVCSPVSLTKHEQNRYFTSNPLEKNNLINTIMAGVLSAGSPQVETPRQPTSVSQPISQGDAFKQQMLRAIASVESSGGKNTNHEKLPESGIHGGTRAFGHYGITPVLAKETLKLNPELAQKYPEIANAELQDVNNHMAQKENAQHDIAKAHLKRLRSHFGDNPAAISHAWLNGVTGTKRAMGEGKDLSTHWHVQKVLNALNGTKKSEDGGDLQKMSRPRITFPNIPKTSTRPDQEVQLIENKQQKDLYGRKVAQAMHPDAVGRRIHSDGSVDENAKINFQARRDEEAKRSANQFGTTAFGVSSRFKGKDRDPISGYLGGSLRSKFEPGDDDYTNKLAQHLENKKQIIKDYGEQHAKWYKTAIDLSQKIKDPGGRDAYYEHLSNKPKKPKLPRKPSKSRIATADLSPERMAARGRAVDSTIEHEGLHHVLAQIQRHHGEPARIKAVQGLLSSFDENAVSTMYDFVKKIGYNPKTSTFGEEMLAHSRDLLVNPAKRKAFEKIYGKENADAVIKSLKQGHQKAYEWAKNVKPEDLGSASQDPKKLAASELSPAHRAMMKSLLQKDRGSIRFKNIPKVTTRPDMQIQNIDTRRQADMFSRHAAQTLHDSPTNRAASKDALDSHFSEKIDMNNDSNVSSDQRYFRELFDKDIPKETLAQTGAVVSNSRQPQRQKGYVFNETGVGGGSVRQHEGIHYLFNSLGPEGSQKAYTKANSLIHPDVRSAMSKYLTNVGYSENGHFKEMVPHLSQIMIDKHFRDMFEAAGETHLDRDFMTKAKQSWQNIRNWAAKVKPEDLK